MLPQSLHNTNPLSSGPALLPLLLGASIAAIATAVRAALLPVAGRLAPGVARETTLLVRTIAGTATGIGIMTAIAVILAIARVARIGKLPRPGQWIRMNLTEI